MSYDYDHIRECRAQLEAPELPRRVFTGPRGTRFSMEIVSETGIADILSDEILEQDPASEWGVKEWVAEAVMYPGFVIACRNVDDGRAVGFLSFDTLVCIHGHLVTGEAAAISVKLEPMTVYVTEADRGSGAGDAFIEVLALQVPAILRRLESMSGDQLRDLAVSEVSVAMEAECVSEDGSRFIRRAFDACQRELASAPLAGAWPLCRMIDDRVDYGDFGEEDSDVAACSSA